MKKNKNIKTKMIDNVLIVSLVSSLEPRLLRIDMGSNPATTIKIKEVKEEFLLIAVTGDDNETEIEKFENKESALSALKHIAEAMFSADIKNTVKKSKFLGNLLKVISLIVIVYLAILFFSVEIPVQTTGTTMPIPQENVGKPVPLDNLLE